jgi:hypothetical protein
LVKSEIKCSNKIGCDLKKLMKNKVYESITKHKIKIPGIAEDLVAQKGVITNEIVQDIGSILNYF